MKYSYKTLRNKLITVQCKNPAYEQKNSTTVTVYNKCFIPIGIFDGNYASPGKALKAFTSMYLEFYSRIKILCTKNTVMFTWKIKSCADPESNKCSNPKNYPNSRRLQIMSGTLTEGMYEVHLKISLIGVQEYAEELMYIYMKKRPPFAFIAGGFKRKVSPGTIILDGGMSYDVDAEPGGKNIANLKFEWICHT